MCFRYLSAALLVSLSLTGSLNGASRRVLRVCADPNNLPFSNQAGEGLENHVAELVAADLGAELQYVWWAERKSFLRNSLQAGLCDMVMGVPSTLDSVSVTRPYYRSTYVFVERADRHLEIASLTDPRLEKLKIGIHIVGDNYAPPAHLLARRGLASQLAGYRLYGPWGEPNPPSQLIDAVVNQEVDVAIIWGPFAGYFAQLQTAKLQITPVSPAAFLAVPFTYDISAAVRKDDTSLRDELDRVLTAECGKIAAILKQYAIPRIQGVSAKCDSSQPAAAFSH